MHTNKHIGTRLLESEPTISRRQFLITIASLIGSFIAAQFWLPSKISYVKKDGAYGNNVYGGTRNV